MTDGQQVDRPASPPDVNAAPPRQTFLERYGIAPFWFAIVSLIGLFIAYQGVGGVITLVLFGARPSAGDAALLRLVTAGGELLFLALPVFGLTRLVSHSTRQFLRLRIPSPAVLLLPAVGIIALQQMSQVYLVLQERIPLSPEITTILDQLKALYEELTRLLAGASSPAELTAVLASIALVPAVAEELVFRGLVFRSFALGMSPARAIAISGIIFGAYHLNPITFVPLTVLGCYLGFVAYRADSLWAAVAAHFYNNAYACIALYAGRDDAIVGGGNPESMALGPLLIVFWMFGVVFLLSTMYFMRITRRPPAASGDGDDQDHHFTGETAP